MGQAKLKVILLNHTKDPEGLIAHAAKLCYSPSSVEQLKDKIAKSDNRKFIEKLLKLGHLSPLEHVSFNFGIEGISRACSHQLVRHRIASYSQQSQRYVGEHSKNTKILENKYLILLYLRVLLPQVKVNGLWKRCGISRNGMMNLLRRWVIPGKSRTKTPVLSCLMLPRQR